MRQTFTDGSVHHILEECPSCILSTAGEHQVNCPMSKVRIAQIEYNCDKASWER